MKLNEKTIISGNLIILVPYEEDHVPKYHDWMKSEELQILTSSEPLTLKEEYDMQKLWRTDPNKCTFIILDKEKYEQTKDEVNAMVGDTNIFLRVIDNVVFGEIEIMIADTTARGKGLGKEAVLFMIRYGIENLNINCFEAKIGMNNYKSISLFEKIGFTKISDSKVFMESTFVQKVTKSWTMWVVSQTNAYHKYERMIKNFKIFLKGYPAAKSFVTNMLKDVQQY